MKNEQEIVRSVFDAYIRDAKASSTKKDRPTFDMLEEVKNRAIKALEQPTSDDCASRADLLKIYENRFIELQKAHQTDKQLGVNWCINTLKDMPPVTPAQRWIPISERLPKEGETVLVCYQTQDGVSQSVCEWLDMPNRGIVWSTLCGQNPKAWMPLPKPYEKRGNEND